MYMLWYDEQAKALFKRETKGELRLHGHVSLLPYPLFSLMVINSLTSSTYLFAWISPTHPPPLPNHQNKTYHFQKSSTAPFVHWLQFWSNMVWFDARNLSFLKRFNFLQQLSENIFNFFFNCWTRYFRKQYKTIDISSICYLSVLFNINLNDSFCPELKKKITKKPNLFSSPDISTCSLNCHFSVYRNSWRSIILTPSLHRQSFSIKLAYEYKPVFQLGYISLKFQMPFLSLLKQLA